MLNQNNAGTSVLIDKWNGSSYADTLDVSSVLLGADWGYESWGQEGLRRISGSLSLGGFPRTALAESLDPRANPGRFQRGNRVRIFYAGESVATLYITGFPLPAHPGKPEFDIELGCVLSLLSYRQPPSDAEEESDTEDYTIEREAQDVILAYFNYAGLLDVTTVEGTCPGSLYVQQKDDLGSWVEEAGKIAFSNGCYIWQKPNGVVAISAIALKPEAPDYQIQVGGWDGQEIEFEPVQAGETPVERVICTGEAVDFDDTGGLFVDSSTEYAYGTAISPFGPDARIISAREIISEEVEGSTRTRTVFRYECLCSVNPFFPANFELVPALSSIETWNYEGNDSGRLLSYSKTVRQPVVAIAQDYAGSILVDQPGSVEDMTLRVVESEDSEWSYDSEDAATLVYQSQKKIAVGIAPTLFLGADEVMGYGPFSLVSSGGTSEKWTGDHDSRFWRHRIIEYGSLAQNARSQQTVTKGQLAVGIVRRSIRTSNTGATQPSSAERREPDKIERREEIEGDAEFLLPAPSPFQERERYYQVPYGNEVEKLNDRAEELGALLLGRSLGASFTLPILGWTNPSTPHARVDFTTPDGSVQSFITDNLSFAIDSTTAVVSGDGIYLGTVPAPENPSHILKPYRERQRLKGQMRAMGQMEDNQPDILDQLLQGQIKAQGQLLSKREMNVQGQARAQGQTFVNDPDHVRGQMRVMGQMLSYPDLLQGQARAQGRLLGLVNFLEAQGQMRAQGQIEEGYLFQQELQGQMRAQGKVEEGSLIGEELQGQMKAQGQLWGGLPVFDELQGQMRVQAQQEDSTGNYYADYVSRVEAAGDNVRSGKETDVEALIDALEVFIPNILLLLTLTDRRNGLGTNTNAPTFVPIINREGYLVQGFNFTEANRITEGLQGTGTEYVRLGVPLSDLPPLNYTVMYHGIYPNRANDGQTQIAYVKTGISSIVLSRQLTIGTTVRNLYDASGTTGRIDQTVLTASDVSTNQLFTADPGTFPQASYYRNGSFVATTTYTSDTTTGWSTATLADNFFTLGARRTTAGALSSYSRNTHQVVMLMDMKLNSTQVSTIRNAINTFVTATGT